MTDSARRFVATTTALLALLAGCAAQDQHTAARPSIDRCRLVRIADSRGPFPRFGASAASDDRYVYIAAGSGVRGQHGRIDRFDSKTGAWSVFLDGLASRRSAAMTILGRRLYIIGGKDLTSDLSLVEVVDLDRRVVEETTPLEPARRWAAAVAYRDRIWVIGGAIGEERIARTDILDPRTMTWSRGPDLNVARETRALVAKGAIWVLGGYAGEQRKIVRSIERLDEGRFELVGEMPMPTSAFSAEVVDDRWIYTFGDYVDLGRVMRFDLERLDWSIVEPGYTPRRHTASARIRDTLIVFGGNVKSGGSSLDLAEMFEERCDQAPAPLREPHRRLDTVRVAAETLVSQILGAEAGRPVPVLERPDRYFREARSQPPDGFDAEEHRALATVWRELGLLANGSPIPLALYDPDTREIYLSARGASPELAHFTLSHEMVHAVRHRLGFYDRVLAIEPKDVDHWLAARALVEGDASLFGVVTGMAQHQGVSPGFVLDQMKRSPKPPADSLQAIERALHGRTGRMEMPYERGMLFVLHVVNAGGLPALKRAFENPPRSTEQILHPEKYLAEVDEPTEVDLELPAGWDVSWSGTIGEFDLLHFLSEGVGFDRASTASAGWDGGRIALLESEAGSMIAMKTVWDSDLDAAEFASAWSDVAKKRRRRAAVRLDGASVVVREVLAR